ncbi:hypothetical protein B0T24DRAFT_110975 [Lasiosphaeria ovina]|uniref:Uncharacterized protein n=1 Tax=Lasiosphaeria ovina TaxID=92902 RepID=A0AAE0MYB7_9PEZI|nr:hypothetical protein B0T24DRAFT_110975 [Lasiosphaeria ovina]
MAHLPRSFRTPSPPRRAINPSSPSSSGQAVVGQTRDRPIGIDGGGGGSGANMVGIVDCQSARHWPERGLTVVEKAYPPLFCLRFCPSRSPFCPLLFHTLSVRPCGAAPCMDAGPCRWSCYCDLLGGKGTGTQRSQYTGTPVVLLLVVMISLFLHPAIERLVLT